MPKYRLLRERLLGDGTLRKVDFTASQPVDFDALLLVHDRAYVEAVAGGGLSEAEGRRLGFPWGEELVRRSRGPGARPGAPARGPRGNGAPRSPAPGAAPRGRPPA